MAQRVILQPSQRRIYRSGAAIRTIQLHRVCRRGYEPVVGLYTRSLLAALCDKVRARACAKSPRSPFPAHPELVEGCPSQSTDGSTGSPRADEKDFAQALGQSESKASKKHFLNWDLRNAETAASSQATKRLPFTRIKALGSMRAFKCPTERGAAKWGEGRSLNTAARSRCPAGFTATCIALCAGRCRAVCGCPEPGLPRRRSECQPKGPVPGGRRNGPGSAGRRCGTARG